MQLLMETKLDTVQRTKLDNHSRKIRRRLAPPNLTLLLNEAKE